MKKIIKDLYPTCDGKKCIFFRGQPILLELIIPKILPELKKEAENVKLNNWGTKEFRRKYYFQYDYHIKILLDYLEKKYEERKNN